MGLVGIGWALCVWIGWDGLGWAFWVGLGGLVGLVGWVGIDWDRLGNVSLNRWGWVRLGELVGLG